MINGSTQTAQRPRYRRKWGIRGRGNRTRDALGFEELMTVDTLENCFRDTCHQTIKQCIINYKQKKQTSLLDFTLTS